MFVNLSKEELDVQFLKEYLYYKEELSGKIAITSHIHGFSAEDKYKPRNSLVTHRILYDQTVDWI